MIVSKTFSPPEASIRRPLIIAVLALLVYFILGSAVSASPPSAFDLAPAGLVGIGVPVAWIFTASCLWPTLTVYGAIGIVVALIYPAWRGRIIFAVIVTLVTWQTSDALKLLFMRPRSNHWALVHETSYSYSSGHAMFAVVVYGLWAYFIWKSALPKAVRSVVSVVLAAWGWGVIWSRLALGAHYPTDLIGGLLLATAALAIGDAVALTITRRWQTAP